MSVNYPDLARGFFFFLLSVGFLQQTFLSYYYVQRCSFSYTLPTILPTQSKPLLFPVITLEEKGIIPLSFPLREIRGFENYWSVDYLSCSAECSNTGITKKHLLLSQILRLAFLRPRPGQKCTVQNSFV